MNLDHLDHLLLSLAGMGILLVLGLHGSDVGWPIAAIAGGMGAIKVAEALKGGGGNGSDTKAP